MSAPNSDGGPAFPIPTKEVDDAELGLRVSHGMTLRDWFAGQALAGISQNIEAEMDKLDPSSKFFRAKVNEWYGLAAERAYCYADVMLAERATGGAE
jgi:hypothetical protein